MFLYMYVLNTLVYSFNCAGTFVHIYEKMALRENELAATVRSLCCYYQCGTCCWAPRGATTFFINPEPCAGSPDNPQPGGWPPPPLYPRMTLHHYQITGTRQHSNDSCQWSVKPSPPFQLKLVTSRIAPSLRFFFAVSCPGVHKLWTDGAKVSVFARSSQQLPTTSDVKWVGQPWLRQAESPVWLPSGEQRKQDKRAKTENFRFILSPSSLA